jgi:hypothetical protein
MSSVQLSIAVRAEAKLGAERMVEVRQIAEAAVEGDVED